MISSGLVPLDCNKRGIAKYSALQEKFLGDTDEAVAYQKRVASHMEEARDKGDYEHMKALKKYAGTIVSQSINLMLYTTSIVTSMFQIQEVEGTNIPAYHLKIVPEIDVWQMSAHGFPNAVVKLSSVTQSIPTPYRISTDRIYQYMPSVRQFPGVVLRKAYEKQVFCSLVIQSREFPESVHVTRVAEQTHFF